MNYNKFTIGRADDNDIRLADPSISRYHLEVFIDDNRNVFITDLDSVNGTFVNGTKIKGSVLLADGDSLRLGLCGPIHWQEWKGTISSNSTGAGSGPDINNEQEVYQQASARKRKYKSLAYLLPFSVLLICLAYYVFSSGNKQQKDSDKLIKTDSVDTGRTEVTKVTDPTTGRPDVKPAPKVPVTDVRPKQTPRKIIYDFSCLADPNDQHETEILNGGSDINDLVLDAFGDVVTLNEEITYGNKLHNELLMKNKFIASGERLQRLVHILNSLTANIPNPRGFSYKIFLIESTELNAFTAGGRIYVTTRMDGFCRSDDERACIIGHEIFHNELGHIKYSIKQASLPGAGIFRLITTPFNQNKETACDMHGIDLAIASGYSGCASVALWKRMTKNNDNDKYDPIDNLFRSHPYSAKREDCSKQHIYTNYGYQCSSE